MIKMPKVVVILCLGTIAAGATKITFNGAKTIPGHEYIKFDVGTSISGLVLKSVEIDEDAIKKALEEHQEWQGVVKDTLVIPGYINRLCMNVDPKAFSHLNSDLLELNMIFQERNGWGVRFPSDSSYMFFKSGSLYSVDLSGTFTLNMGQVRGMFEGCNNLRCITFGNFNTSFDNFNTSKVKFNTSKVENMMNMFSGCNSLTSLDLSYFNTKNVTDMYGMFCDCWALTNLNFSAKFDTRNVKNMGCMFKNCNNIKSLDLSKFNTQNVIYMYSMFENCESLSKLLITGFNTQNVKDMSQMFEKCKNLANLDVSNFDTRNVVNMAFMFEDCKNLTSLDLSNFDMQKVKTMSHMFLNCNNLKDLYFAWKQIILIIVNDIRMENIFKGCPHPLENNSLINSSTLVMFPWSFLWNKTFKRYGKSILEKEKYN